MEYLVPERTGSWMVTSGGRVLRQGTDSTRTFYATHTPEDTANYVEQVRAGGFEVNGPVYAFDLTREAHFWIVVIVPQSEVQISG